MGRLGNGQLRRQVAEWLAARLGPHTVGEIARDLGRSAGAVGNALATFADDLLVKIGCHKGGRGARLVAASPLRIKFEVARTGLLFGSRRS
jgi:DNA-binding transcriptional ArsR family regulator